MAEITVHDAFVEAISKGNEVYYLVGRTSNARVHISVNRKTPCKVGCMPYTWSSYPNLFDDKRLSQLGDQICSLCAYHLCCTMGKKLAGMEGIGHVSRLYYVHWGCQEKIDEQTEAVYKKFLDEIATITIKSRYCSAPVLDPRYPVCHHHNEVWDHMNRWLDRDVIEVTKQFVYDFY